VDEVFREVPQFVKRHILGGVAAPRLRPTLGAVAAPETVSDWRKRRVFLRPTLGSLEELLLFVAMDAFRDRLCVANCSNPGKTAGTNFGVRENVLVEERDVSPWRLLYAIGECEL